MSSDIIFSEPVDVSQFAPSSTPAQSGPQFGDVYNTFKGLGAGPSESPSLLDQVQQFLGYHANPVGEAVTNAGNSISDFFSNLFSGNTPGVPRTVSPISPNVIAGSAAVGAAAIGSTIILTNPGVQQTAQSFSSGFNSVAKTIQQGTNFLTSTSYGPILLVGGLILVGLVVLKK